MAMTELLATAVVLGVLAAGCSPPGDDAAAREHVPPRAVEVLELARRPLIRELRGAGTIAGIREVVVVARVQTPGPITESPVELGAYVKAGAVLAAVDSRIQKAALEQAQRNRQVAERALASTTTLFERGEASPAEKDQAEGAAAAARMGYESARRAYTDTRVTAPISGFIATKGPGLDPGNTLAPGAVVARIVDLSRARTTIAMGEQEVALLTPGLGATVTLPALGETFAGTVSAIASGSDPQSASFPVEVVWTPPSGTAVRAGMSALVTITTAMTSDALVVPLRALITRNQRSAVYTVRNGRAALAFVSTGRYSADAVEITDGVSEGALVLVSGMTDVATGDSLLVTSLTGGRE